MILCFNYTGGPTIANHEIHPLDPGEGVGLFIGPGVIKTPAQIEPFYSIEDSLAAPVIFLGGYTGPEEVGNVVRNGGEDFTYNAVRGAAGNARGLPNGGAEEIKSLKVPIRRLTEKGIKTVIQVTNLPHETPKDVIPELVYLAAEQEPTAVEVNLSCPNGLDKDGNLHPPLANNAHASGEVMYLSRRAVGPEVCLGAKDSPHVSSPDQRVGVEPIFSLIVHIRDHVDFVTGINTIGAQDFPEITCTGGKGGMSGPIVAPVARQHLQIWKKYAPDLVYLSIGGVDSQNADVEVPWRREHGALLVGGAQEFYRARDPVQLAARWAIASV